MVIADVTASCFLQLIIGPESISTVSGRGASVPSQPAHCQSA
jgi:hypothetical protein